MEGSMMIWMLVAGALAVWRFVLRPKWSTNLPPGTMGWPLLGEFISFYFRPDEFIAQRRQKYGNLFKTCLFGYPIIISTDPHVSNFILENDGQLFVPQFPTSLGELFGKSNIMQSRGDCHKKKRGVYMRVVGIPVLKGWLLSAIQNTIMSTLSGWRGRNVNVTHEVEEVVMVGETNSDQLLGVIAVIPRDIMIFSLMANHLLSLKPGTQLEKIKRDFYVMKKGFVSLALNVPGTSFHKSLQKREELSDQIKSIIKERKKSMSSHDSSDDLLSSMLKDAEEKEDGDFEISTFQIVDFILSLMFVVLETTPKTITLAVKRLSENPHIIQELREEHEAIRHTKGNKETLSWDDYKSMSFTKNVITEMLRLGTGHINSMLMRKTVENVEIQGYTIPKGWTCMIFHEVSNLDSNYYEDPLAFNPRRWQDPAINHTPSFLFGGGPRKCPGYEFATLIISLFLHHLVTNFRWDYIPSDTKLRWFDSPFPFRVDCIVRLEDFGN